MEFRVFPQPKRDFEEETRPRTFGRRQAYEPRARRFAARRAVEIAAFGAGAAFLAYLVIDLV